MKNYQFIKVVFPILIIYWISDATGEARATTSNSYSGKLVQATIQNGSGTEEPTDLYDISLFDSVTSEDLLCSWGINTPTAVSTSRLVEASLGWVSNSKMILSITNAGSIKSGTVIVYIR